MLKLGATHYHVTRCGEIDQPHTIEDSVRVEAELSDSEAKDTFRPTFALKSPRTIFASWGGHLS